MIRKLFLALAFAFGATAAGAFDISNMSDPERDAFRDAVRAYLLEHPEVIFEAVDIYQKRQANQQASQDADLIAAHAGPIFNDGKSWVGGNSDGDVTVVEFLDYRCGYCKKAFEEVNQLVESDGNIRFVVKEFPILGEQSVLAARFAIAVRNVYGSESYKHVHDELMTMRGNITDAALQRIAGQRGLDFARLQTAMNTDEVAAELRANYQLAETLGITGTPGFIIQTEVLRGYAPLDAMREIVSRVRG